MQSGWKCWAVLALVATAASLPSRAADFSIAGPLTLNTQIAQWEFTIGDVSDVSMWSTSHMGGVNFDPLLTVWNTADASFVAQGDDIDPLNNGFDARIDLAGLAAGTYLVTVTASPNARLGDLRTDGFLFDSREPEALATWCQPAAVKCGAGGLWQVLLTGVDSVRGLPTVTPPPPVPEVPEPASALLLLAGAAALAGWRRAAGRRSEEVHATA